MKKILLIEPAKVITDAKRGMKNLSHYVNPSLGLLSIGSVLVNHGFNVAYFSPNIDFKDWKIKLREILSENQFGYVGISNTAPTIEADMEIVREVKKILPKTIIVTGGYFSHLYPLAILKHTGVDIVIRGDGEFPLLEIVKGNKHWKEIPGVCFRYSQKGREEYFIQEPYFMNHREFSKIPPLNFPLYDYQKLWQRGPIMLKKQITLYTSKGCPFACRFCSVPYFNNRKMRFLPLKTTEKNIVRAVRCGARKLFLVDPNFTANKDYCLKICDLIIALKRNKKISKNLYFLAQARIDLLDRVILARMKNAGFRYLFLGIENISTRLLGEDINKKNSLEAASSFAKLKLILSFGINPYVYLILGLPTTIMKEVIQNIKFAKKLRRHGIRVEINPFVSVYPETEYYQLYKDTPFIKWEKITFKRVLDGQVFKFKMKLPLLLWPKDAEVRKYLSNLWEITTKIIRKRGGLFANVFVSEAIKTI